MSNGEPKTRDLLAEWSGSFSLSGFIGGIITVVGVIILLFGIYYLAMSLYMEYRYRFKPWPGDLEFGSRVYHGLVLRATLVLVPLGLLFFWLGRLI